MESAGDTYKTIVSVSKGLYKDKGSRFISIAYPVADQDQIKSILESIKKEYHDARHHCYAWMLGHDRISWRTNDDGEPSGTAGKPILGQINSAELTNILIVVVRYFGGTLLGVSGLITAYRSAAADALSNSEIVICMLREYYELKFPYAVLNDVMKVLKEEHVNQSDQKFDLDCSLRINFRVSLSDRVLERLGRIDGLSLRHLETK